MAITGPPSKKEKDFINGGAKTVVESIKEINEDEWTMISVRITKGMLRKFDEKRPKNIARTRNGQILHLIKEYIEELNDE